MLFIVTLVLVASSSARLCPTVVPATVQTGYKLAGHTIVTYSYLGQREVCIEACEAHNYCSSVNYYRTKKECELNNANHVTNPENMTAVIDSEYIDYYQRPPIKSINGNLVFFFSSFKFH